jgi:hypothetical protein
MAISTICGATTRVMSSAPPYGDLFWALTRATSALDSSVRAAGQDNEHFRGQRSTT